ncbi:MAG: hypothetical protein HZB30_07945 [Nitrospirae bacterium]|nr:hypothetical protein [Nitrospirota bacterium]
MKKKVLIIFASLFLAGTGIFFLPGDALSHDVNFNIAIGMGLPPPPVVFTRPPALYVIPGTPVYYVPEIERQLYFYSGNWYRLYDGYWYRAVYNNGPWMYLPPVSIPYVFRDLSPRYYRVPPREQYRARWTPPRYWRPREYRRYEDREKWDDHHDNHRERGFDGRKKWKHEKPNKRWD